LDEPLKILNLIVRKAKPGVSRGRKATGLEQFKIAGLPEEGDSVFSFSSNES